MKKTIKILLASMLMAMAIAPTAAIAAGQFSELEKAGTQAKDTAKATVGKWKWILGIAPIGMALIFVVKMKSWLDKDEGNTQERPKANRIGLLVSAGFSGIFFVFLLYGLFGITFLGQGFGKTWTDFVITPVKYILL